MVWAYRLIWLYYWANKTNRSIFRHHVKLLRPYKHEWAGVLQYLWNESFHSQPIYITSVWVCHLINLVISISVWPHCAIFALWVIIQSRWQQLFYPNQPPLLGNFCKGVKVISVTTLCDFCTLGNHSKPVATIILPKSTPVVRQFL